jgi:hypothetical protein
MQLTQRLQFKVSKRDEDTIKRQAELFRMPLSTYLRLKVLDNEIQQEKESYQETN